MADETIVQDAEDIQDVQELRAAFKQVQADLAVLTKAISALTTQRAKEGLSEVRQAGEQVQERLHQVASDARVIGQSGINSLEKEITDKPMAAVLIAFAVGVLIGKIGNRT